MFSDQLVVLVGGKGTRLGELTKNTPKPLMPITNDKVFLDYFLENSSRQGFRDIILLAGHMGDQVEERYHNKIIGNARISVIIEPTPLGTGGAFRYARERLAPTFIAANGDTLFDINMRGLDAELQQNSALAGVLALRHVEDSQRYGSVVKNSNGTVVRFAEKEATRNPVAGFINGGIYALRRETLDLLPEGSSSIETDLFPKLVEAAALGTVESNGYFLDIGLPSTLEIARRELPQRRRPALFLDRDGVINVEKNYLHKVSDFEWIEGVKSVIKRRNDLGHSVIVVTNQAGVAKGLYEEADIWRIHQYIQNELHAIGAFVDAFYYCPYHEHAIVPRYKIKGHPDRKPNPGMLLKAAHDHPINLSQSSLIGDMPHDVAAAAEVGVKGYLFNGGDLLRFENESLLPELN